LKPKEEIIRPMNFISFILVLFASFAHDDGALPLEFLCANPIAQSRSRKETRKERTNQGDCIR
jgi:hypothetical protein